MCFLGEVRQRRTPERLDKRQSSLLFSFRAASECRMETAATILHADLDSFFASVEQLLDPSLRGKPIAVGGGVVLAASYEAKAWVRSAMPGWKAQELCPSLIFVAGHFNDYQRLGDAAQRCWALRRSSSGFRSICAFADLRGCTHLFGSPARSRRRSAADVSPGLAISIASRAPSTSPKSHRKSPLHGSWSSSILASSSISCIPCRST